MSRKWFGKKLPVLILLAPAIALTEPQKVTLQVKGFTGTAPVVQLNGKAYVELESLARITNSAIRFQGNQVLLAWGAGASDGEPAPALSKSMMRAGVDEMSAISEWRSALATAIQTSAPVTEDWAAQYERNVENKLALVGTAAASENDRNALPLFRAAADHMKALSDKYVAMRKSLSYIPPDSLVDDLLDRQVENCAQGLRSMTASGQLQDLSPCRE
jgi:hypothetical protein